MRHVEDSAKRFVRFGMYTILAFISGTIGFLGFRPGDTTLSSSRGGLISTTHADAPLPPPPPTEVCYKEQGNSYCVGPSSGGNEGGNGGWGGNGSDNGSDTSSGDTGDDDNG